MSNNTHNVRTVSTGTFKIHGNCLEFNNTVIQLSNVSMFLTEEIKSEEIKSDPFPFKSLLWIVACIICGFLSEYYSNGLFVLLGVCSCLVSIVEIIKWCAGNKDNIDMMALVIITNSGDSFAIVFNSRPFLQEVIDKLRDIISNPSVSKNIVINIKDNKYTEIKDNTFTDQSSAINTYNESDSQ